MKANNLAWMLAFFLAVVVGASAAETTRGGDFDEAYWAVLLGPLWLTAVAFAWSSDRRS